MAPQANNYKVIFATITNILAMNLNQLNDTIKHKEIDLIQDVIKRMAANSFQVKTWMMGIVTAILAFKNEEIFSAGKTAHHAGIWISLVLLLPIICFWFLDGFFLKTEKLYREVYRWVIANRELTVDHLYDLNIFKREDWTIPSKPEEDLLTKAGTVWGAMWSKTLMPFYAIPFVMVVALVAYNLLS